MPPILAALAPAIISGVGNYFMNRSNNKAKDRQYLAQENANRVSFDNSVAEEKKKRAMLQALAKHYGLDAAAPQSFWDWYQDYNPAYQPGVAPQKTSMLGSTVAPFFADFAAKWNERRDPAELVKSDPYKDPYGRDETPKDFADSLYDSPVATAAAAKPAPQQPSANPFDRGEKFAQSSPVQAGVESYYNQKYRTGR